MNLRTRVALVTSAVLVAFATTAAAVEPGKEHHCFYPPRAYSRHAQGITVLQFEVTADGHVQDISVEESSGDLALDHTAEHCARNWRYLPARHDGKPIAVQWEAKVEFTLANPVRIAEAAKP